MKPSRFTYHAPSDVDEALGLLHQYGDDAKILAGGQSLMPFLSFRLSAPAHLIDINRLPGLDALRQQGTRWTIPALVRQRQAERSAGIRAGIPILAEALEHVAHPQIRNRGTVCGSLAHADAAAELPALAVVLDATLRLASKSGTRVVRADDFFLFHLTTVIRPDELLTDVSADELGPKSFGAFRELAPRRGDFAIAGVAAVVEVSDSGTVERCRVVASGVAPTPARLVNTERALTGDLLSTATIADAVNVARSEVAPAGDFYASASYRRRLVGVLLSRVLGDVVKRSGQRR